MTVGESLAPPDANAGSRSSTEIIRVLHIDDEESQQIFLKVFIEGDPNIKVTSVSSAEETLELVQTGDFDCLVSDYDMPDMDGIALAKKIRETSNIPIIIYTGRGSEEVAEKAFAAGIDDYIRKETEPAHYQIVSKRIRQAVERRRINESYRNLFDNANDMISIHTFDGRIVDINEVGCKMLGYSKADLLGETPSLFGSPQNIDFKLNLEKVKRQGHAVFESTHITREGTLIPVEVSAKIIKYMGLDVVLSFSRDITMRKRLEAQMKERLEALQSHALVLSKCEDVKAVAKTTYKILHDTMGYSFFGLGIVDGGSLKFIPNLTVDDDWSYEYPINSPGVCGRSAKTGSSIIIPDVRLDPEYIGPKTGYKYLSEIVVPVKIAEKVVAVINIEDEKLNRFTRDDAMLLEIFSEHVASSLNRINLLDSTRRYLSRLEQINRHAAHLMGLNSLKEVAEYSFDIIQELTGFADGCIGIVEGDVLKFEYARDPAITLVPDLSLDGKGITIRAVRTGNSQLVHDTRLDPDFVKDINSEHLSELDVPVKVDGRVVAVINLEDQRPNYFSEEDRETVEILSEHIASAISRIKQFEVIKESEKKYRKLLDSSLDSVLVMSGTKIIYSNDVATKLVGYNSISELIGRDFMDFIPDEDKAQIKQRSLTRQRGEPQPNKYELRLLRKDGTIVEVEVAVSLTEIDGKPAALSFARDISDRKRYQNKLVQLHGSGKRLAETSTRDEIWDIAIETVSQILGFDFGGIGVLEDNAIKYVRNVGDDLPKDWRLDLSKPSITSRTIETGLPQLIRDTSLDPDYLFAPGTVKRGSELATPITVKGQPVAILNIESMRKSAFTEADVSLIQILVSQVASALDRIAHVEEESWRREAHLRELLGGMERMSGMVTHDLRGPLQTIQSSSYMLRARPERIEEFTRKIDESVDYAVRILEDLKIMTNPGTLNKASTNLRDLVEKSLNSASIPNTVSVVRNLAPLCLEVDQYRIRRVVDNLVKNAVEAMRDGGTLTLKLDAADGMVKLAVRDTGSGITDEAARNLFTPFCTTKSTGMGLGLAICKQVVELHGGKITFESRVGKGTVFNVALPMAPNTSSSEEILRHSA